MEPSNTYNHKLPPVDQPTSAPPAQSSSPSTDAQAGMNYGQQSPQPMQMTPQMMQQQMTAQMAMGGGLPAADIDLIEKAWVAKAKAIVHGTHGNPYLQSHELSKVKAEYIKKRYNKDIKVAE